MMNSNHLRLHEEIALLMLDNEKGTLAASCPNLLISGALLAELLMNRHISVANTRKKLVEIQDLGHAHDPIAEEGLQMIKSVKRPVSLKNWVSRVSGIKHLRQKVLDQLCARGILRAVDDTVLFVIPRRRYPQINPQAKNEILARLHTAIFRDENLLQPHTVILASLANGAGLLDKLFGRKEIRARKKRIEKIVNGEITGTATKEVIEACQWAAMAAIMTGD